MGDNVIRTFIISCFNDLCREEDFPYENDLSGAYSYQKLNIPLGFIMRTNSLIESDSLTGCWILLPSYQHWKCIICESSSGFTIVHLLTNGWTSLICTDELLDDINALRNHLVPSLRWLYGVSSFAWSGVAKGVYRKCK